MRKNIGTFAESAKGFTKSPLGIVGLFVVFVDGFASLVMVFSKDLDVVAIYVLIGFLVLFPVLVFGAFVMLVVYHHEKLYGPSDFKDEWIFYDLKMSIAKSLYVDTAIKHGKKEDKELLRKQKEETFELVLNAVSKKMLDGSKNKILWVDDNHNNNIWERKFFESIGITFDISATNTDQAIELLKKNDYVAIISDMGRKEGENEGYVLLEKVRDMCETIPFFVYTGYSSTEDLRKILQKGGQGITHLPDALYKMVMERI
jgi:CheY-like chemotaxis protein